MRNKWVLFLAWLSYSIVTVRGEAEDVRPRGVLFPWEMPGISYDFRGLHRDQLRQSWNTLKNLYLPLPESLYQFGRDKAREFTHNQRRKSEMIAVSRQNSLNINESLYLQPVLCPFADRIQLIFLLGHYDSGEILQIFSQSIITNPRQHDISISTGQLQEAIRELWGRVQTTPQAKRTETDHVYKLSLGLLRGGNDQQAGSFHCANLKLAEALLPFTDVHIDIGHAHLLHSRDMLKPSRRLRRSNHKLSIDWPQTLQVGQNLPPGPLQIATQYSESVFGKTIQSRESFALQQTEDGKIVADPRLLRLIEEGQKRLKSEDWPMVVATYGAWAYVDRGRAWGLEMNDRLWIERDGQAIKGHVVKFFGPELKLRSPRGFWITEGSIVFIRTGQKEVKVGDILRYDPTEFPTPWPPESTPLPQSLEPAL
ncbi:MAG: hypothetical protein ACOH5I_08495 [Oligoflexus sp.]